MNLGAIFLLIAALVLVAVIVFRPFLNTAKESKSDPQINERLQYQHIQSSLMAEKERLLSAVQELEFDHETGKIPDDLFREQRQVLMQEAARVLANLDQTLSESNTKQIPSTQATGSYDELEELIAKRRLELNQKSTGFCPKCGKALLESDKFCPKCGTNLQTHKS